MKWPKDQVAIVVDAFEQVIAKHGLSEIREHYVGKELTAVHKIWRQVWYDLQNDDNHPAYAAGRKRFCSHNPAFKLYPDGCNDSHMQTMLNHVGKVTGIVS